MGHEKDMEGTEHQGVNRQKNVDREESFKGSRQTLLCHICEDISNKSGLRPKSHGIVHKFTNNVLALPTRKGSGWQNSQTSAQGNVGKKIRH